MMLATLPAEDRPLLVRVADDDDDDDATDTAPTPAWDTAALIAAAVAAFTLSAAAVAALAAALVAAQQRAYTSAYAATVAAAGGDPDADAASPSPSASDDPALLAGWRATAEQTAQGVAATYSRELRAAAGTFLAAWLLAHGSAGASAALAALALATFLRGWAAKRAQSKGAQMGATAANAAATAGAAAAVADILAGEVASADDPDTMLDPDALAAAGWGVVVLPEAGMCDLCATYAGNVYRLDDAPDVFDLFPAHPGCWHSAYLVPPDEVD